MAKSNKKPALQDARTNHKPGWLPKPQVRILAVLSKTKGALNRRRLAEKSEVPETHLIGFTLKQYSTKPSPALVELGLVKSVEIDVDGRKERVFEITAKGRKALTTAQELAKAAKNDKAAKAAKAAKNDKAK